MLNKKGFTLIEVVLFLALSGALVASLIAGTSRSISQKRYNDTVDNFVDYLQGLYSDVNYVQGTGIGGGNTNKAIYGKIIISNDGTTFDEYTVLGSAACNSGEDDALDALNECTPNIANKNAMHSSYRLSWGGTATAETEGNKIAILIITHPKTGMKSTYLKTSGSNISITIDETVTPAGSENIFDTSIPPKLDGFSANDDINFCISSDDEGAAGYTGGKHKLIRIHKNANNASSVEIMSDQDKGDTLCGGA